MGESGEEARRRIRAYLDYLEDADYVRGIFALADVPATMKLLITMLRHGDAEEAQEALLFVRDVVNYGMVPEFRAHLPRSGLFTALADGLYDARLDVRDACIHTLGTIGAREQAPALAAAFPHYVERDPLLLPHLVGELAWLTNAADLWDYLGRAAASPCYLSRWASLDATDRFAWDTRREAVDAHRLGGLYSALAADPQPFVAAEAAHRLAELHLGWEASELGRGERQRRYRALRAAEPRLTFLGLTTLFRNCLPLTGRADYTVDLLDRFAQYAHAHPFNPTLDLRAYAQAFAASETATPPT